MFDFLPHSRPSILVLEADGHWSVSLAAAFAHAGEIVEVAWGDETELAKLLRGHMAPPSLLVLDTALACSADAIERLRSAATTRDLPIVAMATKGSRGAVAAAFAAGADDCVNGPFELCELVARVRVQLRHAARLDRLRREAVMDELTGVANRRGLMRSLKTELDRARRSGRGLSLLLIDIDEFKGINDQYGHLVGDDVLVRVARCLENETRSTDVVCRLGGDEFVVILPEVDRRTANTIAERIRGAARRLAIAESSSTIGISIGLSVQTDGSTTPEQLLAAADDAMYRHKAQQCERGFGTLTSGLAAVAA